MRHVTRRSSVAGNNVLFCRLTQAMIVFHEELMEEIYDWMGDAEKQADSIAVNEDDISSVMEEYGRHRVWTNTTTNNNKSLIVLIRHQVYFCQNPHHCCFPVQVRDYSRLSLKRC